MKDPIEARVLVVDDDSEDREILEYHLAKEKCDVMTAKDGNEALSICRRFRPEIVFLDINLPPMDGIEVLKRIKRINCKTEVVMVTGEDSLKASRETFKHGAFTHMIKPVDPDKLLQVTRRALGQDKGFNTKRIKNKNQKDNQLLEHFHDENLITKLDALIAVLNETGLVTETELLEKVNFIKGLA